MGLKDLLSRFKKEPHLSQVMRTLSSDYASFSSFGDNVLASDLVEQALHTICNEVRKMHFHFETIDGDWMRDAPAQHALDNPNQVMSRSDFLENVCYQYLLHDNAWVYVERDIAGRCTALYPLQPIQVTFLQGNNMAVSMRFRNGDAYTLPYSSLIHIRSHFSEELMGGKDGDADRRALLRLLDLNHTITEGVDKAIKSSYAINMIVKYNTYLSDGKLSQQIERFEEALKSNKSGILPVDMKSEVQQLNRQPKLVDAETLKFVDSKILRHFGVSSAILSGDYTSEQYHSFYSTAIEPILVTFSDAFTKTLCGVRKYRIKLYPELTSFMTMSERLQLIQLLAPMGGISLNEARALGGLEVDVELNGLRMQSLNWVSAEYAKEYQMKGGETNDGVQTDRVDNRIREEGGDDSRVSDTVQQSDTDR